MALNYEQISTVLNTIVQDVTGQSATFNIRNTGDFVAAATTALSVGTDPIMNSISQMIGRTIISVRPYEPAANLIDMDSLTYGNVVRKITPIFVDGAIDQPMYDDQPADGQSTDQYKIKRPRALETRFSGFSQWMVQAPTVFEDQLRAAFSGPSQLDDFLTAQMTAVNNEINSQKEALAHSTIANFIGAKSIRGGANFRHVLTEYNTLTGLSLTIADVYAPENFESFVKWLYAYIADCSDLMTKRSTLYHEPITGYTVMRHTPKSEQRLLMYSFILRAFKTMALSGIYNDDLLKMDVTAPVEYWQSLTDRTTVKVNASYTDAGGDELTGNATVTNVIGILFDRQAMGVNVNLERTAVSPLNSSGLYYNTFYHFTRKYYNDISENAIVFCLD